MTARDRLLAALSPELVAALEQLVDERVRSELAGHAIGNGGSPYLTVEEAAKVMRAKPQRIYDLLSSGRLTRHKDGTRVLVERDEVDEYLEAKT